MRLVCLRSDFFDGNVPFSFLEVNFDLFTFLVKEEVESKHRKSSGLVAFFVIGR